MNEALIVGALLLVLLGAVSFYLYSRIIFSERKMGLIESLLLDIKMSMDMEEEHRNMDVPPSATASANAGMMVPKPVEVEEVEEYQNVLEEAQAAAQPIAESVTAAAAEAQTAAQPLDANGNPMPAAMAAIKNYDDYSRDDLSYLAEKRGLRVTKRMAKGTIIALLQEADKTAPQQGDDVAGSATTLSAVEGSAGGAPLDAVALEEMD